MDSVVLVGVVDNVDKSLLPLYKPYMWGLCNAGMYIFRREAKIYQLPYVERYGITSADRGRKICISIYGR
jgi:hypothetical protein